MSRIRTGWLAAAVALTLGAAPAPAQAPDTATIKAHTYFLSHDRLQGRGTGTEGAAVAALYIATQCRLLGLTPAGPDYLLPVPLERARVLAGTRLTVSGGRGTADFSAPEDFTPNVGTRATLASFEGPAVFVGAETDVVEGRIGDLDLTKRVAVTLGPFRGAAADTLVARGAVGMVHLVGDAGTYALYRRSRGGSRIYHRDAVRSSFLPPLPSVLAGPQVAALLLADVPLSGQERPAPQPLGGTITAHVELAAAPVDEANVGCVLAGRADGTRDTAIAVTAHYDHLGVSTPDAQGDSIYNGFSDDAAGVAMSLAIAEALAGTPDRPAHAILFLFFTGEERGLLGSDFYVARPAWPLDRTLAVVNLDAGAPPALPVSWRLAGADSTTGLGAAAIEIGRRRGWQVRTSPASANSDYFPFYREGVPSVFIVPGPEPYEGLSADSSKALRTRWDHYHEAADEWSEDFPFAGLGRYAEFALELVLAADRAGSRGR